MCWSMIIFFFFFNDTATTEIYTVMNTLSLHDALPIWCRCGSGWSRRRRPGSPPRSEEHTSELQSLITISYAVFCLKKKKKKKNNNNNYKNINNKKKKQKQRKK